MNSTPEIQQILQQIGALKTQLSEARRRRPTEPVDDAKLLNCDGSPVMLSELFGDKRDLLVVHNMGKGCSYCTMWADGFVGALTHLRDRAAFVVARAREFQPRRLPVFSSRGGMVDQVVLEGEQQAEYPQVEGQHDKDT